MTLPCDDINKRAEAAQRQNYRVGKNEKLPAHIEFELSRLIEKYKFFAYISLGRFIIMLRLKLRRRLLKDSQILILLHHSQ